MLSLALLGVGGSGELKVHAKLVQLGLRNQDLGQHIFAIQNVLR